MRTRRLALFVALLAGCAPQTTMVPPVGSPSPAATAPEPTMPSVLPAVPDDFRRQTGTIKGTIYDESGQVMREGVTVRIESLNPSSPFDSRSEVTAEGTYEVRQVPPGVQLRITANKPGWTARKRIEAVTANQTGTFDFGALSDITSAPFGLSNYPEVVSIEPGPEQPVVGALQIKVTLSEPLDAGNRATFAQALKIVPANEYAAIDLSRPRDISAAERVTLPYTAWPYAIGENATLDNAFETRARISWDAEGRVATFTLPAPLLTSNKGAASYNVVLAAKVSTPIVDAEGLPLGTNAEGKRGTQPSADDVVIENAFLKPALSLTTADLGATPETRWALLHVPAARFTLLEDDAEPRLQAVGAVVSEGDTRITLRFSKPLAAFNGTREGRRDPGLAALPRYTFVVGPSAEEVERQVLTGDSTVSLSADTIDFDRRAEFELSPAADNPIEVELDPAQPSVLRLIVRDNGRLFATTIRAIKVRAEGVTDPAGNVLNEDEADANTIVGSVQPR